MVVNKELSFLECLSNDSITISANQPQLIIKVKDDVLINVDSDVNLIVLPSNQINIKIKVFKNAKLNLALIAFNSNLINLEIDLLENSYFESNILTINNESNLEIKELINHLENASYSSITNRTFALNKAFIKSTTTSVINKGIKYCNANQLTRGVIINNNSKIEATPILLIDEYETKAYHGATIGQISDENLFYLMSRGLTKNEAVKLVLNGLFLPTVEAINNDEIKNELLEKYQIFFKE